jgi:hypothetical protein
MCKKTYKNLTNEIKYLEMETNKISDAIDIEESQKEKETFDIKKRTIKYHTIKRSDLPMFRKYEAYQSNWLYKLDIVNGKLTCLKMEVNETGEVNVVKLYPEMILDYELESTQEEWHDGVCKLLKYID